MRFVNLEPERMSEAQKRVHDAIAGGPRGGVRGPFGVLLRSPELADRVQKVGEHLRFNSSLPARLNEFAILINARFWGSKYEWYAHRPFAIKGGLAESIADDLAQNRRPAGMKPDEALIYAFCTALHRRHAVDDAVFEQAVDGPERGRHPAAGRRSVPLVSGRDLRRACVRIWYAEPG